MRNLTNVTRLSDCQTWMSCMRRFIALTAFFTANAWIGQPAHAEDYPSREIKLICGFPAGSGADVTYRFVAEKLRPLVGKPVIVENRPGLQGYLASAEVAKSKPDGHTIMLAGGSGLAAVRFVLKHSPVDPFDFAPDIRFGAER